MLEGLRTRKPPAEFQDVCLKFFYAVRATLQQVLHAGNLLCAGVFTMRAGFLAFVPPFSG